MMWDTRDAIDIGQEVVLRPDSPLTKIGVDADVAKVCRGQKARVVRRVGRAFLLAIEGSDGDMHEFCIPAAEWEDYARFAD